MLCFAVNRNCYDFGVCSCPFMVALPVIHNFFFSFFSQFLLCFSGVKIFCFVFFVYSFLFVLLNIFFPLHTIIDHTLTHTCALTRNNNLVAITDDIADDDYETMAMSKQFGFLSNTRAPCECASGVCGCCTGMFFSALRQLGCLNITYAPEDFSFELKMIMNNAVLYKSRVTGRNPPPVCVRVPRLSFIKLCASFYDLYFVGRNMHVCLEMGAYFRDSEVFNRYGPRPNQIVL